MKNYCRFVWARVFGVAIAIFASTAIGLVCAQEPTSADANDEVKKIEKTLPDGGKATFVKIGQEAAYATVERDGKVEEFDAFEPLSRLADDVRPVVEEVWNEWGEIPGKTVDVEIDVSQAPDATEWAERAKSRVQYWFPKIVDMLDGEGAFDRYPEDFKIRLVFKEFDGVAHAAGAEITVSSSYIERFPDDFGLVVHETTHIAQRYPRVREVWAMEGMTDYVRYYITEARAKNKWRVDPKRSKYTDSYGVTATFFDWIVRNKDPEFIRKIHRVFRERKSVERFCENEYQTTFSELWNEFISSLTNHARQD